MKYLIAGTGGVGGSMAAFLSLAGKDVTCIARGEHLRKMKDEGLKLKSGLKGEHTLQIDCCTAEDFQGKADVIFVFVSCYSIYSITHLLFLSSHNDTILIPILLFYVTFPLILLFVPCFTFLFGCIYLVGFVS